ncbi:hypothetical protein J4219_05335 [Candidatus Woesearchaeota archaeon]|nr:hypothetical protein [Candidatus Woesearchaeota archaeon]
MRCYEEGLTLHLLKRHVPQICLPSRCLSKGYFEVCKAVVILPHVESFDDLAVTVLHELIHARDDFLSYYSRKRFGVADDRLERLVDEEAMKTYAANPLILQFISELHGVDMSGSLPPKSIFRQTVS